MEQIGFRTSKLPGLWPWVKFILVFAVLNLAGKSFKFPFYTLWSENSAGENCLCYRFTAPAATF